jgi:CO/xanthine dehydrogenase FAD-binding subunit
MINFEYSRAMNIADAVHQMALSPRAKFIAGGTNLVDLMKVEVEQPAKLIDVTLRGCHSTPSMKRQQVGSALARSCATPISPIIRWWSGAIRYWRVRC